MIKIDNDECEFEIIDNLIDLMRQIPNKKRDMAINQARMSDIELSYISIKRAIESSAGSIDIKHGLSPITGDGFVKCKSKCIIADDMLSFINALFLADFFEAQGLTIGDVSLELTFNNLLIPKNITH